MNRRQFLTNSAKGLAALTLGGCATSSKTSRTNTLPIKGGVEEIILSPLPRNIHDIEMDGQHYMILPLEENKDVEIANRKIYRATSHSVKFIPYDNHLEEITRKGSMISPNKNIYFLANVFANSSGNQEINYSPVLKLEEINLGIIDLRESTKVGDYGVVRERAIKELKEKYSTAEFAGKTFFKVPFSSTIPNSVGEAFFPTNNVNPIIRKEVIDGNESAMIYIESFVYIPISGKEVHPTSHLSPATMGKPKPVSPSLPPKTSTTSTR
jgi:hypothetical protein